MPTSSKDGSAQAGTGQRPPAFEEMLAEIEAIVRTLEEGKAGLSQSLSQYERGVQLLRACHQQLEHAEERVRLLVDVDAAGQAVTVPFDTQATLPETPAGKAPASMARNPGERPPADMTNAGNLAPEQAESGPAAGDFPRRKRASKSTQSPESPAGDLASGRPRRGKPSNNPLDEPGDMDEPGGLF